MPKVITNKEEIISKCTELFSRHGYAGTSISMIANEMGLSKASIYHYVNTKEELLIECAKSYIAEARACFSKFKYKKFLFEFYKDKLEVGCFMFNMISCQDSLGILRRYIIEFILEINAGDSLKYRELAGVLSECKFVRTKSYKIISFKAYLEELED